MLGGLKVFHQGRAGRGEGQIDLIVGRTCQGRAVGALGCLMGAAIRTGTGVHRRHMHQVRRHSAGVLFSFDGNKCSLAFLQGEQVAALLKTMAVRTRSHAFRLEMTRDDAGVHYIDCVNLSSGETERLLLPAGFPRTRPMQSLMAVLVARAVRSIEDRHGRVVEITGQEDAST